MNKVLNYLIGGLLLAAMASQSTIAAPSDQAAHTEEGTQHADEKQHPEEEHAEEDHAEDEGEHGEEAGHEDHREEEEEPELTLSADLLRGFGGEIATAEAGVIRQQVSLPGEVKLNEEAVARAMLDGVRDLGLVPGDKARLFLARVRLAGAEAGLPDFSDTALMDSLEDWLLPFLGGIRDATAWRKFDLLPALRAAQPSRPSMKARLRRSSMTATRKLKASPISQYAVSNRRPITPCLPLLSIRRAASITRSACGTSKPVKLSENRSRAHMAPLYGGLIQTCFTGSSVTIMAARQPSSSAI